MYPHFNQKRFEQLFNSDEKFSIEVANLYETRNLFLSSELGDFKIYQN